MTSISITHTIPSYDIDRFLHHVTNISNKYNRSLTIENIDSDDQQQTIKITFMKVYGTYCFAEMFEAEQIEQEVFCY